MNSTASVPAKPGRSRLHRFLIDGIYVLIFNFACAVMITYVFGNGREFWRTLLISNCIGLTAFTMIDGIRLLVWGNEKKPSWPKFILLLALSMPIAQFLGAHLAGLLLGAKLEYLYSLHAGLINGLVFTLMTTAAATLFFGNRDRLMRARAEAALEKARAEAVERQALQAQLQLLQAQIEPHMLFNTLANLQGLIGIDPARAQQMLDQLIRYLRATLLSSRAQSTTLEQEFALMDAYLGLMSVRMGERLSYAFELPEALQAAQVPPMLLQPLVENAIAHGLEPKIEGGHIAVSARMQAERLELSVADNGRGPDAGPGKEGTNVGLSNTRERLQALYGNAASLTLEAVAPAGALARILLPIQPL
ncbi:histidine kinase [Massilia sp. erpn]|nr:histidine kinase [Massilia sp. erpn]